MARQSALLKAMAARAAADARLYRPVSCLSPIQMSGCMCQPLGIGVCLSTSQQVMQAAAAAGCSNNGNAGGRCSGRSVGVSRCLYCFPPACMPPCQLVRAGRRDYSAIVRLLALQLHPKHLPPFPLPPFTSPPSTTPHTPPIQTADASHQAGTTTPATQPSRLAWLHTSCQWWIGGIIIGVCATHQHWCAVVQANHRLLRCTCSHRHPPYGCDQQHRRRHARRGTTGIGKGPSCY